MPAGIVEAMARSRYALNSVTAASFGMSWASQVTDQDVVDQLFNELEGYRILYEDVALEDAQECVTAAGRARGVISELLKTHRLGKSVKADLRSVRGYFAQFASDVREQENISQSPQLGSDQLGPLLHTLRQSVGQQLGMMAGRYDVGVPGDLARVIPDQSEWFYLIWSG